MITIIRYQESTGWTTSGKLADLERQAKQGKLAMSLFLLCWQIAFYGESYVAQLPQTENVTAALALLGS